MTNPYTLEFISKQKAEKKAEILDSQKRMQDLTQQLFAPTQSKNKMDSIMQHINMGMATYDGIMTGLKILRRVQAFFRSKKKPS